MDQPALFPPPGITSNLVGPYTLNPYNRITTAICIVATGIVVALRLYIKQWIVKRLDWEDASCFLGWASFMVFMAFKLMAGDAGSGTHQWNVSVLQLQRQKKIANYEDMVYSITITFTKLSIFLLILRVFVIKRRETFWWVTQVLICANTIFYVIFLFIPVFLCRPREKIWNDKAEGKCLDINKWYAASGVFNVISDISMLYVPAYKIWHLQLSTRRKIGVSSVFGFGVIACVFSIVRLGFVVKMMLVLDWSYYRMPTSMCSSAEVACALLCSSLPFLPRLYQHFASSVPTAGVASTSAKGLADPSFNSHTKASKESDATNLKSQTGNETNTYRNLANRKSRPLVTSLDRKYDVGEYIGPNDRETSSETDQSTRERSQPLIPKMAMRVLGKEEKGQVSGGEAIEYQHADEKEENGQRRMKDIKKSGGLR